ncbi:MAG TPA: helical backbone metal receptor, partial [Acidimicrobiales bacterium]|nr:helical backbone metal receptor [Acidimicrobiales bacterium]
PDLGAIVALRPDLVVVDREENRAEDAAALTDAGLAVHVLHVTGVSEVAPALAGLAERLEVDPPPLATPAAASVTLSAFVPIWRRPWMSVNGATYGSSLLAVAGIANVLATASERYPTVTLSGVADLRPDVVLAPSEPYPFRERHRAELEQVGPVTFVDGRDLFWWGVRTPSAAERLAALGATLTADMDGSGRPGGEKVAQVAPHAG